MIAPPPPPPLSSNFDYLMSAHPPDEAKRLSMCKAYDDVWPNYAMENVGQFMRAAMRKFGTNYASVSFFDETDEVFRAENGYNKSRIPRTISIAAHSLCSTDVMVILDTKEVCELFLIRF